MMSESVTVTVQNGAEANRGAGGGPGGPPGGPNLALNVPYFRSLPGMVKIAQLVLGILCIIFGSAGSGGGSWFTFVAITAFIVSIIWTIIYLFSVREAIRFPINWILTELFNTGIYAIVYFTAFIVELAAAGHGVAHVISGIFGIFNTLAYAAGTYFLYLEYQNNQ